jgi:hypothetical protein
MKEKLIQMKEDYPDIGYRERFKMAAALWGEEKYK